MASQTGQEDYEPIMHRVGVSGNLLNENRISLLLPYIMTLIIFAVSRVPVKMMTLMNHRPKKGERPDVSSKIKRVGPFLLGPILGNPPPVKCMTQCLARRNNEFFTLKILTLRNSENDALEEQQGKILLSTEHKLLCRLKGQEGIIQHKGFFKEVKDEEIEVDGKLVLTGSRVTRLCLVLDDALTPHDFKQSPSSLTNLQYYVLKNKKLPESEAVGIFRNMVQIVERLHQANIVHRDLKLGNITLNIETKEVILSNFCLGKELDSANELLTDQRGSPAYISPDVISGKPYHGKPSDMWALGVAFYTMLYGQFPFYHSDPQELFKKIKYADFKIPEDTLVGSTSVNLIKSLLVVNPNKRLTATELLQILESYITLRYSSPPSSEDIQVVAKCSNKVALSDSTRFTPCVSTRSTELSRKRPCTTIQNKFDLEEVLIAMTRVPEKKEVEQGSVEGGVVNQEPPRKRRRYFLGISGLGGVKFTNVDEDARVLTVGDMNKLYALHTANKARSMPHERVESVAVSPAVRLATVEPANQNAEEVVESISSTMEGASHSIQLNVTVITPAQRSAREAVKRARRRESRPNIVHVNGN